MWSSLLPNLRGKVIILGTQSPRRKEIFAKLGLPFEAVASGFAEDLDKSAYVNRPEDYVVDNARFKALELAKSLNELEKKFDLIIGADTVITFQGVIYEKPKNEDDAKVILKKFSGSSHDVLTGVVLLNADLTSAIFWERTTVNFSTLDSTLIDAYVATQEPMDKAGAYGIQGFGAIFVESIVGDYYNVMGLPLSRLYRELARLYN